MVPLVAAAACGDDGSNADDGTLRVVASFYPLAEAAERVGGERITVTNLTPAGTEPHDIELSPDQVDLLEDADLVVYLGEGFQPAVEEVVERRDGATLDLLAELPLEAATEEAGHDNEEEEGDAVEQGKEGARDPHFWLDPTLLADAADEIAGALGVVSPDDAASFRTNADTYIAALQALDADFETALGDCERDEIVTSHAAFHYLAERYGLQQLPITGLSPESEPDPGRLADLSDLIGDEGITTLFYETLVSPDVARTLARETGVDTGVLNPIEGLTDDELDDGKDYEAVMRENLATLEEALGCR